MPQHFAAEVAGLSLDVSMAELQGHLLRYKGQPLEALVNVGDLAAEALARQQTSKWNQKAAAVPPGGGDEEGEGEGEGEGEDGDGVAATRRSTKRRLHGSEADRVVFNPQEGWEDTIGQVVRKR
jgi:hypothetical protein